MTLKLKYGRISPYSGGILFISIEEKLLQKFNEREVANGSMYRLCSKVVDAEQRLKEKLNDEQLELLRKFNEAQDKHHMEEVDEALLYGFRFGVSLINELREIKM